MNTGRLVLRGLGALLIFLGIFAFAFWFTGVVDTNGFVSNTVASYGYLGIIIISFVSGFNVVVPIPAVSFMPAFLAAGLNFWIIIILMSIGMTLADSISYFIGKSGRLVFSDEHHLLSRIDKVRQRHPSWPLGFLGLWASFAPLPNELLILPLSFLGYRLWKIFLVVLTGNLVFNTLAALGVVQLFNIL